MAEKMKRVSALLVSFLLMLTMLSVLGTMSAYANDEPEYDREWDRVMLPGWGMDVRSRYDVWMPDGEADTTYEVTDVKIKEMSDDDVIEMRKEGDEDPFWHIDAHAFGDAVVTVFYKDIEGKSKSYDFTINVSDTVYGCSFYSDDGWYKGLPGREFDLVVDVWKESRASESEPEEFDPDPAGMTYEWEIVRGKDYADLTPVGSGETAKLTFKALKDVPHEDDDVWEDVEVRVCVKDPDDKVVNERNITFNYATRFFQIVPTLLDNDLGIGETENIDLHLSNFTVEGGEGQVPDGAVTFFFHYDRQDFDIKDKDGKTVGFVDDKGTYVGSTDGGKFTVTRLCPEDARFQVEAVFTPLGAEEPVHEWMDYNYNWLDYNIWFDRGDYDIWSDSDTEIRLEMSDKAEKLLDNYNCEIDYSVGDWGKNGWEEVENKDYFTVDDHDWTKVTFDGKKFYEDYGDKGLRIRACLIYNNGDEKIELSENDAWLSSRKAELDYNLMDDEVLMKGWSVEIHHYERGWIQDAEHEDGEDFEYVVKNVELSDPDDEKYVMLYKEYDNDDEQSDHYWWMIRGMRFTGDHDVEVKVTYCKWKGDPDYESPTKTYVHKFKLAFVDDLYDVGLEMDRNSALPGDTVKLYAPVKHTYYNDDGYYQEEWDPEDKGLEYEWTIQQGEDLAKIEVDKDFPKNAKLKMGDLPEGSGNERLEIAVIIKKDGRPVGRSTRWIELSEDFYTIVANGYDEDLLEGDSQDVTVELRHYYVGCENKDGYDLIDNVYFKWWYDDEPIEVRDSEGTLVGNEDGEGHYQGSDASRGKKVKFAIKKKENWNTDVQVTAEFRNHGEDDRRDDGLWYNELNYDFWFNEHVNRIYGDGDVEFSLNTNNIGELLDNKRVAVRYSLGDWNDDGDWEPMAGGDNFIKVDPSEPEKVKLDGKKLQEHFGGEEQSFFLMAELLVGGKAWPVHDEEIRLESAPVSERYEYEDFQSGLPGWKLAIPANIQVARFNNSDPYGEEEHTAVMASCEITNQDPAPANKTGIVISDPQELKDEKGNVEGWLVECKDLGEADIKLKGKDPEGKAIELPVHILVPRELYDLDMGPVDGSNSTLPGGSIDLKATALVIDDDHPEGDVPDDMFLYWEVTEGEENVTLSTDKSDQTKAKVTFKEFSGGQHHAEARIQVSFCTELDGGKPTEGSVVAVRDVFLEANNMYMEVSPLKLNEQPTLTKSVDITPQVMQYTAGEDPEAMKYVDCIWEFDPDGSVIVVDEKGQPVKPGKRYDSQKFTFVREGLDGAFISLQASWPNRYGDEDNRWANYGFEPIYDKYPLSVDPEKPVLIATGDVTCTLDDSAFKGVEHTISFEASVKNGSSRVKLVENEDFVVDGNEVTFFGSKAAAKGSDNISVIATVMKGDKELTDYHFDITLKDKCDTHVMEHFDKKEATCTKDGMEEHYKCKACNKLFVKNGEDFVEKTYDDLVIKAHHAPLTHVKLKKATAKAAGNIEYWTCSVCGTCFGDAEGKTVIAKEDTVIPVNNFKVTVKKKSYTAKTKKKTTLKAKALYTVKNKKGIVTYKKYNKVGKSKITVSKAGTITVKKGLKKGTYKVKVKVTTAATSKYTACYKIVTVTIKVKVK